MYPESVVSERRESVISAGATSLERVKDVHERLGSGRAVVVVNSVCGCAADTLTPALQQSLSGLPDDVNTYTVFAGVDDEATAAVRTYFDSVEDSSPSVGFLDKGDLVSFLSRSDILELSVEELEKSIRRQAEAL